jgi:predicted amidophosphoribosyltransferase
VIGPLELIVLLLMVVLVAGAFLFGIRLLRSASQRSRSRECPRCGAFVKRGDTVCQTCGYDFAATA